MDNKLEILIVEDDKSVCEEFENCVDKCGDIVIVGVTNSSDKAIELIMDYLPDAVILDLELHHGSGNGLLVLDALNKLEPPRRPYMLVTTNNSSTVTYETARAMGADFIMSKHQNNYSVQGVLDFLRIMSGIITQSRPVTNEQTGSTETAEHHKKRITRRIIAELNYVGINPKAVGYQYLIDAIAVMAESPTQNICEIVAKKHSKTEPSVERAMQNAINRAWKTTDIDELLKHYTARVNSNKGCPTLTEFICYYANKLKSEY